MDREGPQAKRGAGTVGESTITKKMNDNIKYVIIMYFQDPNCSYAI